jgi:hypothetical protein
MTNIKDDINLRRGGFYWKNGQPYLSTTEILKVIDKPALRYWFGREVYRAMLKDPTLDEKTALAAPYVSSDKAKARGTTVHSIADMIEDGEVTPEFQLYKDAYWQAVRDLGVQEMDLNSRSIFDEEHKVAGTLDKYWLIGGKKHITDIKTGKDIYPEVGLQNSSYAHMMRANGKDVDEISVLLLVTGEDGKPTGKYKFATLIEDHEAFLAAKKLYEWTNREKLLKAGYLE